MSTHVLSSRSLGSRRRYGFLDVIGLWRQRRALASLGPALLDDVGISPEAAQAEAARPLWDLPAHWRGH